MAIFGAITCDGNLMLVVNRPGRKTNTHVQFYSQSIVVIKSARVETPGEHIRRHQCTRRRCPKRRTQ